MAEVTSNQVKEMIDQLAAMTAAASITPEIVASIFEKMRNLNDQEREKVIKVATEYIEEIRETGVDAEKCHTDNGSNVQEELNTLNINISGIEEVANDNSGKANSNSISIEQKVNALISCVTTLIEGVVFHSGTPFVSPATLKTQLNLLRLTSASGEGGGTDASTTSICGQAICGQAICGN